MKRRILLVLAMAVAMLTIGGPASAVTNVAHGYWGCIGNYDIDLGVCLKNPIPPVDLPDLPRLPL